MVFFTFFLTITFFIYFIFIFQKERRDVVKRRLAIFSDRPDLQEVEEQKQTEERVGIIKRIFQHFLKEFKRSFKQKVPGEKEAKIERKLLQAGNPFGMTPIEFRLLQISLFILFPVLFTGYGMLLNFHTGGIILLLLLSFAVASYVPHFYLKQKMKQRFKQAVRELPDVLDLLTVSLEAGLGFDSALSKLVSKKEGVLADEFHRCLEEIRLGKTRREALSGVKDRLDVDEIKVLISSIIQAEKLGIGMVQVLRIQSAEVRDQRKSRAEEEAMKAPIKMLFPLVLFIFPSIFIVLLGPAILQFIETFQQ
ncbi:tight adherence protein C [Bacillus mesophilus]|uniref:Type II secretion system F family protein n=1 Tax=Bacillus mesophilus TaxID=1808955 RepID=A0A6M0Q3M8_9BACI|nr:type II secretion system F family protein [Bacillus mesophilus]MBM7660293.1 tight adherence protein C [Bacillus mesophilus]NEY71006.1 type II secretion system F family protein [Bacillus mesophilus]